MPYDLNAILDAYDHGNLSRRGLLATLASALGLSLTAAARAQSQQTTFAVTDVNHVALNVTDINRSRDFYVKHLGMTVASQDQSSCFLRCTRNNFLALFKSSTPGMDHYCFSIPEYNVDNVVERLNQASLSPRQRGNRVYFDDPDAIEVQLAATDHNV